MKNQNRHEEVNQVQAYTKLTNCALLAAYVYGQPGGWYCVCSGHVDGFRNDYALIHSVPGNLDAHNIRVVCLAGAEFPEFQGELDEVLAAQAEQNNGKRPLVMTITAEEKAAALQALREAAETEEVTDVAEWLETLCKSRRSDVSCCDWSVVADAVRAAKV